MKSSTPLWVQWVSNLLILTPTPFILVSLLFKEYLKLQVRINKIPDEHVSNITLVFKG